MEDQTVVSLQYNTFGLLFHFFKQYVCTFNLTREKALRNEN